MAIDIETNDRAAGIYADLGDGGVWEMRSDSQVSECYIDMGYGQILMSGGSNTRFDDSYVAGRSIEGDPDVALIDMTGNGQVVADVKVNVDGNPTPWVFYISGDRNSVDGVNIRTIRRIAVEITGDENKVHFTGTSFPTTDNTYDTVTISGDDNEVEGFVSPHGGSPANQSRYAVAITGTADGNHTCVIDRNAQSGQYNHPSSGSNTRCAVLPGTPTAYTESNVTTDRSYDADSTTVDELADVLGTLIADLRALGIVG